MPDLTIVIPALNAAAVLPDTLAALAGHGALLVVDGGSTDATVTVAKALGATVILAPRGRGAQLRSGAEAARGVWLLFLHADTVLDENWPQAVDDFCKRGDAREKAAVFKFALDDPSPAAHRLERVVAWRTGVLGLPYGDQGLLIHRSLYDAIGGFRDLPLMEDVDIVRRLGRRRLEVLDAYAVTSAARWRRTGWLRRSARNVFCLSLYFAGVPPHAIARVYGR